MSKGFISKKFLLPSLFILASAIGQLFIASPAHACEADGKTFSAGDTYGPYVCLPDGTWKRQ